MLLFLELIFCTAFGYGVDGMKQRNFVHKNSQKFNRPAVHQDQKREVKKNPKVRDELRQGINDWRNWAQ